jgi:hypothetical protein
MKKVFYIPLSLIIGLISFLIWIESDNDDYDHEDTSNSNEARGVKKERQEEFKPLRSSENIIPINEVDNEK